MRVVLSVALALLAITTLSAASSGPPAASVRYCATKADPASLAAHSKTSSFAPHAASQGRVYGAPIQSRILKSRPKKKPQLTSTPLPESTSAKSPSGG